MGLVTLAGDEAFDTAKVIDLATLSRNAMNDADVARDVLTLFLEQSSLVLRHIWDAPDDASRQDHAHLLRGSAMAVGAVKVAEAARALEKACAGGVEGDAMDCIVALHAAVAEARAVIAGLLEGSERARL